MLSDAEKDPYGHHKLGLHLNLYGDTLNISTYTPYNPLLLLICSHAIQ